MRTVLLSSVLAAAVLSGCKRDQPSGMPPATEWQSGDQGGGLPPPTPGDKADPRSAKLGGNPHGDMGGGGGGGGVPQGEMPDDDVHKRAAGGGGGGGDNLPPDHPPMGDRGSGAVNQMSGTEDTGPRALEKQADGRYVLGPFTLAVPAEWKVMPVTKGMRAAHFILSDKADEKAELIVFYQGENGMGPVKDNLDRWAGQVKGTAKTEQLKFAGQDAHYMTAVGDYENTTPGMAGSAKDQMVIGVILQSPQGPYYFKLIGAKKTVEPQAAKVRAMFDSLKLKS